VSLADLVAAGAPELPDGWFYRVTDDVPVGFKVQIRESRRRFGSRLHAETYVLDERFEDAQSAVVDACRRAHASLGARLEAQRKYQAVAAYIGDHDPRRTK
jgi:hypothetical protein